MIGRLVAEFVHFEGDWRDLLSQVRECNSVCPTPARNRRTVARALGCVMIVRARKLLNFLPGDEIQVRYGTSDPSPSFFGGV